MNRRARIAVARRARRLSPRGSGRVCIAENTDSRIGELTDVMRRVFGAPMLDVMALVEREERDIAALLADPSLVVHDGDGGRYIETSHRFEPIEKPGPGTYFGIDERCLDRFTDWRGVKPT